jgi:hypothetical protein
MRNVDSRQQDVDDTASKAVRSSQPGTNPLSPIASLHVGQLDKLIHDERLVSQVLRECNKQKSEEMHAC